MSHQGGFYFHGAETMSADIDHIVYAAHDPEAAVFIFARAVAGKVHAGNLRPVLTNIAIGVVIDGPQHTGPGFGDNQESSGTLRHRLAFHSNDLGNDTGKRPRGGAGFRRDGARERSDHDVAGFGLPPGIDDRTAITADDFAVPHPGLGINWLADGPQETQAGEFMFLGPLVSPFYECANRSGSCVEDAYLMAVDDVPETIGFGKVWRALIHQAGSAILQRAVDDVAVPGDPADVGGTPVSVFFLEIEDPFRGDVGSDGVSASGVNYALGFSRGSRGVKNV